MEQTWYTCTRDNHDENTLRLKHSETWYTCTRDNHDENTLRLKHSVLRNGWTPCQRQTSCPCWNIPKHGALAPATITMRTPWRQTSRSSLQYFFSATTSLLIHFSISFLSSASVHFSISFCVWQHVARCDDACNVDIDERGYRRMLENIFCVDIDACWKVSFPILNFAACWISFCVLHAFEQNATRRDHSQITQNLFRSVTSPSSSAISWAVKQYGRNFECECSRVCVGACAEHWGRGRICEIPSREDNRRQTGNRKNLESKSSNKRRPENVDFFANTFVLQIQRTCLKRSSKLARRLISTGGSTKTVTVAMFITLINLIS